jgi:peroxiredoxin
MRTFLWVVIIFVASHAHAQNSFAVGDTLPDFSFQGQFTRSYTLGQMKGSYVLVHFWASWNDESRKMQRSFIDPFVKYKDKRFSNGRRFNIISISIDENEALWELALKKDNLPWKNNLCEKSAWRSPLLNQLKVHAIPANYLVDPNGIIVKVNLDANELEQFLKNQ